MSLTKTASKSYSFKKASCWRRGGDTAIAFAKSQVGTILASSLGLFSPPPSTIKPGVHFEIVLSRSLINIFLIIYVLCIILAYLWQVISLGCNLALDYKCFSCAMLSWTPGLSGSPCNGEKVMLHEKMVFKNLCLQV